MKIRVKGLFFGLILVFLIVNLPQGLSHATDISMPFSPDADTILLYHFDEGSGNPKDSSGKGNDGILYGAKWVTDGKFGWALQFDGVDDYVDLGDKEGLDIDRGSFTIEAWVKLVPNPKSIAGTIFGKGAIDYNPGYSLLTFKGHLRLELTKFPGGDPSFTKALESEKEIPADSWHHVACVYNSDKGEVTFYIDGLKDKVVGNIKDFLDETLDSDISAVVGVAALPRNANQFEGMIDEIRVSKIARYDSDFKILVTK